MQQQALSTPEARASDTPIPSSGAARSLETDTPEPAGTPEEWKTVQNRPITRSLTEDLRRAVITPKTLSAEYPRTARWNKTTRKLEDTFADLTDHIASKQVSSPQYFSPLAAQDEETDEELQPETNPADSPSEPPTTERYPDKPFSQPKWKATRTTLQTWTWTPNLSLLTDQAVYILPAASKFALTATGNDLPVHAMFVEAEGFKRLLGLLEYLPRTSLA